MNQGTRGRGRKKENKRVHQKEGEQKGMVQGDSGGGDGMDAFRE